MLLTDTGSWSKAPSYCCTVNLLSVHICAKVTFPSPEKENKICILYFRKNNASHSLSGVRSRSQEPAPGLGLIPRRALLSGSSEQHRKLEERGETVALTEGFAVCFCFEQKRKKQLIKGHQQWLLAGQIHQVRFSNVRCSCRAGGITWACLQPQQGKRIVCAAPKAGATFHNISTTQNLGLAPPGHCTDLPAKFCVRNRQELLRKRAQDKEQHHPLLHLPSHWGKGSEHSEVLWITKQWEIHLRYHDGLKNYRCDYFKSWAPSLQNLNRDEHSRLTSYYQQSTFLCHTLQENVVICQSNI